MKSSLLATIVKLLERGVARGQGVRSAKMSVLAFCFFFSKWYDISTILSRYNLIILEKNGTIFLYYFRREGKDDKEGACDLRGAD